MASGNRATLEQQLEAAQQPGAPPSPADLFPLGQLAGPFLFFLIAYPLCQAAMVQKISRAYLGQPMSAWEAYARAAPRLLPLLLTNFLMMLVVWLGFMLLIVPGIIFLLWFMVVLPVVVLERRTGTGALNRSRELMRDNLGKGLRLGLAVFLLALILGWALTSIVSLIPWPHASLAVFAQMSLQALILPIQTAPSLLLYYDLRIRKEAFDLEQLAAALPEAAAA